MCAIRAPFSDEKDFGYLVYKPDIHRVMYLCSSPKHLAREMQKNDTGWCHLR